MLFFAFAGYARIATLGEEVVDPARTIPRAIPIALGITLVVYAIVAVSALAAVGPEALAGSDAPLATAVAAGDLDWLVPAVRIGGTIAALGVLLSLIAGVSRTAFAMAADRELPAWLAAVHPIHQVPHRAEVVAGAIVVALVAVTDLRGAIGFSSFCVLTYYAITNASAWTLPSARRLLAAWLRRARSRRLRHPRRHPPRGEHHQRSLRPRRGCHRPPRPPPPQLTLSRHARR